MKIKLLTLFVALVATAGTLSAQNLTGKVTDQNGEPLIGASVYWADTTVGGSTDTEGNYIIYRVKGRDRLVAAYLGFTNDTLQVADGLERLDFQLEADGVAVEDVVIEGTQSGNYVKRDGILKNEMISFAGLCKMACCTLAESFENSASVTVGYSDAISGARQIKMLGLAGTYTQILDENRPIMRGLSAPYGLSYTPGMWLNSIQVSKGVASVAAGHEAITGQINLEHRKPTDEERLFVNFYLDDELRPELNLSSAIPLTEDKRLSTVILFHGSADTDVREMDHNHDHFRDQPETNLLSLSNRWLYQTAGGTQVRWGFKLLQENRLGGMMEYEKEDRSLMARDWDWAETGKEMPAYGSHIRNREAGAYFKIGTPVGKAVWSDEEQEEMRSNLITVIDFDHYDEDAYFGLNDYYGQENVVSLNAAYQHYFTYRSSLILGLQAFHSSINESLANFTPWIDTNPYLVNTFDLDRSEQEVGLYGEYTYAIKDKFSLVLGVRGDYNAFYDRYLFTPRSHIRWSITPLLTLRLSAGMGYRSTNVFTDNIGILTTGRKILFQDGNYTSSEWFDQFDRMEEALTMGGSLTQTFSLAGYENATLSFDFFRTEFNNSVVVDQEWDPTLINIYNTDGKSYTNTYQVDFSWTPVERLDIFATYRYTDSKMTIRRPDGSTARVERPLVNDFKTLLNIQYATRFRRWVFDVTAQYNGSARIPSQTGVLADATYSPNYPMFFAQVTRKVGKFDLYVGCENIGDYRQEVPILSAENPYSAAFNSMNVWGPLMGRKFYFGLRFNLY
ncbi:MAG: TonB-dependent receptor [Rikenellaceae bacterium]|nr:TonB-dependent receptor [Rikenellaceae bacterium]